MDKFKNENFRTTFNSNFPNFTPYTIRGAGEFGYVVEAYSSNLNQRVAIKRTLKNKRYISREHLVVSDLSNVKECAKHYETFYSYDDKGRFIQNLVFEYMPSKYYIIN